ncbi:hydantoinase/carbamoylase family amidase [Sphingomonas flavalba]|uniref:hydantoinase/carbamoylase family amidase n=1 Tax=Sphingomonas flavalba TaxID=2559804 RepID=UPI0039DFDDD3
MTAPAAAPPAAGGAIRINAERLMADMRTFRSFGADGTGVVRRALSAFDVQSREWLADRYREAGLVATFDRVGNVFAHDPRHARALLIGSHGDTQPRGGWLDGAMGVIIGLEIARAAREAALDTAIGIDTVCWSDEEARFAHFLGSRAYCGLLPDDEIAAAADDAGVRLTDAIAEAGYADLPPRGADPARHAAYLEAHIEQGPVLDRSGDQLGVVTAIVGAREFLVSFSGEANHAGTTPMALRKDAGLAMIRFAAALDTRYADAADDAIVWTMGRIEIAPNAPSIVPAGATISVQFRGPDLAMLDRFETELMRLVLETGKNDGPVGCTVRQILDYRPTPMDKAVTAIVARAAERTAPGRWRRMPSGAGHDAQFMAPLMPTGMLFVPSIGGISHSFDEDTAEADIVAGCRALALAAEEVATRFV